MARWALVPVLMALTAGPLLFAQAQQQQASITGIVRDAATRRAVARAVVTASGPKRLPSVLTDTSGRFAFDGLDPGSYGLAVLKGSDEGSYGRRWVGGQGVQLPLAAGQRQEIEILLWPNASIAGTAFDERNEPLVDVAVTAMRIDDGGSGQRPFSTGGRTDDRGMYEVGRLPPGRYAVCVGIAHRTTFPEFDVMARRPPMLRELRDPGGQILALSYEPLPPAADASGHLQTYVTTCSPSSKGLRDATEVFLQLGEQRTGVDVHMRTERQFRVSGRIVQPQDKPGDIDLSLVPVDSPAPGLDRFIPTSASKGERFLFMSVPAGEYILKARRNTGHSHVIMQDERGLWSEQRISVRDTDISDLLVEMKLGGSISGRFVCEGDAAARCWVFAPSFVEESFMGEGTVAQDGSFTITGVRPGSYRLELGSFDVGVGGWRLKSMSHKGRDVTNLPIDVDTSNLENVVVTMTKQRTSVAGMVRDGLGTTADAVVVVFPEDATRWLRPRADQLFRTVSPSPDGRYEILDLSAGSYLMSAVRGPELNAWPSVATLQSLRSAASRVQVAFGQPAILDLQVRAR